ncbi:MAG: hypothetical protein M1818_002765 [Claussenomyces sp. TS43310]|nr:MAG: hypothetical protein M1818_002765 [Claussenomyces sp. TS43310]
MANVARKAQQVKVTFKALTEGITPAERIVILDDINSVIPIGRASKSASKGLQAATGNAWFNSPVMSREHAEVSLDIEDEVVTIRDVKSMHGTRLNDTQLCPHEYAKINNGDTVVFGAEVRRGPEVFPACSFVLNYEFCPSSPSMNTIKFPESSDIEEEDYTSDVESRSGDDDDDTPAENVPHSHPKSTTTIEPIDLTGDSDESCSGLQDASDEHPTYAEQSYDLSGEDLDGSDWKFGLYLDGIEPRQMQDVTRHALDIPNSVFDGENEDGSLEIPDSYSHSEVREDFGTLAASGGGLGVEKNMLHSSEHGPESTPSSSLTEPEIISRHTSALPSIDSHQGGASVGSFEDVEMDTAIAYVNPGLTSAMESFTQNDRSCSASVTTPARAGHSVINKDPSNKAESHMWTRSMFTASAERQPSPSDAALVKNPAAINKESTEASAPVSSLDASHVVNQAPMTHLSYWDWNAVTARELGDKTGKHAFFQAREENRVRVNAEGSSYDIGPETHEKDKDSDSASDEFRPSKPLPFGYRNGDEDSVLSGDSRTAPNDQATSAETKNSTLANSDVPSVTFPEKSKQSKPTTSTRSSLKIHDIVDQQGGILESTACQILKRKADAISDMREDEIQAWAASRTRDQTTQSDILELSEVRAPPVATSTVSNHEPRSTKKLKRFAEAVGYATLGGVAVGAGLFSVLVATAPDFV